ncbi:hypothetical protein GCM10011521_16690 [Arenimonas soli]|uniref:Lipoprotein n=1 Tax=Arenimonas soli TaxID=2269504 RepID=A0ABQ1HK45_9GAMM|nr:hypothetical protein GCM10011521_16690 [Arenimonas soli]
MRRGRIHGSRPSRASRPAASNNQFESDIAHSIRPGPAADYTRRMKTARLMLLLLSLVLVAACGNKGDLVRPAATGAAAAP